MKKAILLLSGGLDSAVTLAYLKNLNIDIHAIHFNYWQKHGIEIRSANKLAEKYNIPFDVINLPILHGSSLTDKDVEIPKDRKEMKDIPSTYVPARNIIFLSFALNIAMAEKAQFVATGVNAIDYSGYPDCRPEFIEAFQKVVECGTNSQVRIMAPLIGLSKDQIIKMGSELGVDFSITHSCYDPIDGKACGHCDSCIIRAKAFIKSGIKDTTKYAEEI